MSSTDAIMNRRAGGNFLTGVANLFATRPYRPYRIPPSSGARHGEPLESAWNTNLAIKEGLKKSVVLAAGIGRIVEKAAKVPWHWWRETPGAGPQQEGRVGFIEYPRQDGSISRFEMMEEAHNHSIIDGNALFGTYWEGMRRRLRPRELQVEYPYGCDPVVHRERHISAYRWDDSALGGATYWDAADVCHIIGRCDPGCRYWGWSILQALAPTIDIDREARRLNLQRLQNAGYPGMIVTDEDLGTEYERDEAEEDLNARAEKYFGGFMILTGKQKLEEIKVFTAQELGLLEQIGANRDECAMAIGLHPAILSTDASTLDNLKVADRMEWQLAKLRNDRFADGFSAKYVERSQRGRMFIAPSYDSVPELQDMDMKIDQAGKLVQQVRVATNDALQATGLNIPPQAGGDEPLVMANLITAREAANDPRD